jgi:hypothetical protein
MTTITFSTCWYPLKAKFPDTTYFEWMDNLLSNVVNYYLVVYTDESQYPMLYSKYGLNENIKFIVKPLEQFYNYKHRDFWINNHRKNTLLNSRTNWELNMLWSEKVHFVNETMTNLYFEETEYYGWMDIGYFRCRPSLDIGKESIKLFPNKEKIQWLNPDKIHYALVNMDIEYMPSLINIIRSGNPIPPNQVSVAGGFFIGHKTKIGWWRDTYQDKLETYIAKSSLVKDDQIIIADCIFSELMGVNFELHHDSKRLGPRYDPWFLFSYYLL